MTVNHNDKTHIQIANVDKQSSVFFELLTRLDEGDIIHRADCKFCNHPLRMEAEKRWEEVSRSYPPVQRMFEEYRKKYPDSPTMTYTNVRNHLLSHFDQSQRRKNMREYSEHLLSVMNAKRMDDKKIETLITALEMRFMDVASDHTKDLLRQSDMLVKIALGIAKLITTQAELRGDIKVVNIFMEKFKDTFIEAINIQEKDENKQMLLEVLETVQNQMPATEDKQ